MEKTCRPLVGTEKTSADTPVLDNAPKTSGRMETGKRLIIENVGGRSGPTRCYTAPS